MVRRAAGGAGRCVRRVRVGPVPVRRRPAHRRGPSVFLAFNQTHSRTHMPTLPSPHLAFRVLVSAPHRLATPAKRHPPPPCAALSSLSQNFITTIVSTQLTRYARNEVDGGPATDQLATMEKVGGEGTRAQSLVSGTQGSVALTFSAVLALQS
jgi:hypothetical protein